MQCCSWNEKETGLYMKLSCGATAPMLEPGFVGCAGVTTPTGQAGAWSACLWMAGGDVEVASHLYSFSYKWPGPCFCASGTLHSLVERALSSAVSPSLPLTCWVNSGKSFGLSPYFFSHPLPV